MTNDGFVGISGKEDRSPLWEALSCGEAALLPDTGREMMVIWLLSQNGALAATLQEEGQRRGGTLPLPAIGRALVSTGAAWLFMAHNHPSGDPCPSHADIAATRQIWRLARTLGASLQDHLVIGSKRIFSFRASGLL